MFVVKLDTNVPILLNSCWFATYAHEDHLNLHLDVNNELCINVEYGT